MARALILVDIQNDFMPWGALPAQGGDEIIPLVNRLQAGFDVDLIVATQDWHPPNHGSFASNHEGHQVGEVIDLNGLEQNLWPDHCVQNTEGSDLVDSLETDSIDRVFQKGVDPEIDSYSGFFDNGHRRATGLAEFLKEHKVDTVYLVGVATDYCVKFTALDARREDFETYVIEDAVRGVDQNPGDSERALAEMKEAGCRVIQSSDII